MEHHLLPTHACPASAQDVQVRCRCDPPFYHGQQGDFLTYPSSRGRPWLAVNDLNRYHHQIWTYCFQHPQPTQEMEVFYQEWLFFGFLKEALGHDFDPESCTRMESGVRLIDTSTLQSTLDRAFRQRVQSDEPFENFKSHLSNCLMVIVRLIGLATRSDHPPPGFDQNIIFSITSSAHRVLSSLSHAIISRYGFSDKHVPLIPSYTLEYPNDRIKQRMLQAGWCPSELQVLTRKFQSLQTLVAISRMDRNFLRRDHTDCTTDLCSRYKNRTSTEMPKHTDASCSCSCYHDDQLNADIRRILMGGNGNIPVLDIKGHEDSMQINVVEATVDTSYVAFSHVWADGLGNPNANALPRCQLSRLQRLAQHLASQQRSTVDDGGCYVWVDTICCPCGSKEIPESLNAKRAAINLMRKTYAEATWVLVLDEALQGLDLNRLPAWEALLWIFTSSWSSRLWCLQEGVLPANLCFQFHGQAVSFYTFKKQLREEAMSDSRVGDITLDLTDEINWLDHKRSPSQNYAKYGAAANDFIALIGAIQGRAVSVASDEALCITTVLGVSLEDLQSEPEHTEDRMCKLWDLVEDKYQGIPVSLLLCEYPQLARPGYRWAPRSLLKSPQSNWQRHFVNCKSGCLVKSLSPATIEDISTQAKLLGLGFKTSGFVVQRRKWNDGLDHDNPWQQVECQFKLFASSTFQDPSSGEFHWFWSTSDVRRQMAGPYDAASGYNHLDTGPCAVLMMAELSTGGTCTALIGKLQLLSDGQRLVTHPLVVTYAKRTVAFNLVLNTAQKIAHDARRIPCVRVLDQLQSEGGDLTDRPEFQEARQSLFDFLLSEARSKLEDEAVMKAVTEQLSPSNGGPAMYLGIIARDWFFNDYQGLFHGPDTEWIVD